MHRHRPFDPRQPFPRFRALQAGLPRATVDSPAFRRLLHGVVVAVRHGVRVSVLVDLFVELADELSLVELVVAGDWMVRRHRVRIKDLRRAAQQASGHAGRLARRAAGYVRAKVDSPMETRLRMLIVLAGLPEPVVNASVRVVEGEQVRRFDLSWPEVKVVVEYDGRHHVERIEQWEADIDRREDIEDEGWRVLVVVASGIYTDPARTVARVFRLLRARGLTGLPDRPAEDWRPHFPGRLAA
jgi:hypothetical protein